MTEPMIRLKVNFVPEEQLTYLTIVQGEGAGAEELAYIGLGAEGLTGVINILVDARSRFTEKVPDEPPNGSNESNGPYGPNGIADIVDPRWQLAPEPTSDGPCLRLRHPGLGWLGFVIPPSQAEHIQRKLGEQLESLRK